MPHERGGDKRRKPQSRVWGRHSPTSFPRGAKPQNCGFWHRGRNLLCNCRRLPLSGSFAHRTDRAGLPARCGRSFFLSPKILLKGCQLPAGRGFFKISLCPLPRTIIKNAKRRGKNFSLTYYSNLKGSKWPKTEPVKQKKQQIFFKTYCFRLPPVGGRYSVFMARPADSQTGT